MELKSKITVRSNNDFKSYQLIDDQGDGLSWDSAGHETHDGQGTGHEAGDHTDHHVFLHKEAFSAELLGDNDASASIETLLDNRLNNR